MEDCYWGHTTEGERFACFDGENTVCARCCVEHCQKETPDTFAECLAAGHPTWPNSPTVPRRLVCLEGYWNDEKLFDQSTVQPFLEGLAALDGGLQVAHRRVGSVGDLGRITTETIWGDLQATTAPVFYLAFHGRKGRIQVGDDEVGLKALTSAFEGYGDAPHLLYFGTCGTLGGKSGERLAKQLLEHAGSRAVVGYTEVIPWMQSMLIDLLFMQKFFSVDDPWDRLREIHQEVLNEISFAKDFGFTMFTP